MTLSDTATNPITIRKFNELEDELLKIHNYKYLYTNSIYSGMQRKMNIECKVHGEFYQIVSDHRKGRGCKLCANELKTNTTQDFIDKAKKLHKNIYDYTKTIYTGRNKYLIIACNKHGDFLQEAGSHLNGRGCPKCSKLSKESFIELAMKKHGNKYLYTKILNPTWHNKQIITCKLHGDFKQISNNHLQGNGCKVCAKEKHGWTRKRFKDKKATLYVLFLNKINAYKVGITTQKIKKRYFKDIKTEDYNIIFNQDFEDGAIAFDLERKILNISKTNFTKYSGVSPFKYTGILEIINQNPINKLKEYYEQAINES